MEEEKIVKIKVETITFIEEVVENEKANESPK